MQNAVSGVVARQEVCKDRPTAASRRYYSAPSAPQLLSTISPVFGGLEVNSFRLDESVDAAEMADYCFNRVMDSWLDPKLKPRWWEAFFQHPLVFHRLSYSCGILQDVSNGRVIQYPRLVHRLKTIQIVNKQLGDIDNADPEPILLAITTLWRINTDKLAEKPVAPLIFSPHRRGASWVAVAGKLGGDDIHSRAMVELVNRVGGMSNFTTLPSLQETLTLGDVLHSSANASKPLFPPIWDVPLLLAVMDSALQPFSDDVEGRGFANRVPGGLPVGALTTLQRLSMIDKLLDNFSGRTASVSEDITLAQLGNALQHELLSLPPWQALDEKDQQSCYLVPYGICRITSMLYSNGVIFPIAPSARWLEKLLRQLRSLLETSNRSEWDQSTTPMLIWSLFIAGMAAYWTSHRAFLVTHLRSTLAMVSITSWDAAKPVLQEYLWRDDACEHGAAILWNIVQCKEQALDGGCS